jgi:translocation and assembly module TamB
MTQASVLPPTTGRKVIRVLAWIALGFTLLLILIAAGLAAYSKTNDFQTRVRGQLASALENATGGKVDVGPISLDVWHLFFEVDNLVIHGLEPAGEAPYLAADKVQLRLKLFDLLSPATLSAPLAHIGLDLLRIESPRVHLIVDKDGRTNQPTPKKKAQSGKPVIDTLLDLKANQIELINGLAVVNDRPIPFNLAARDMQAEVRYLTASERYAAKIDLKDLVTQINKRPDAHSTLHLEAELGRDVAALKAFDFRTGDKSEITATAGLSQFAKPVWNAKVAGTIELKELTLLADLDGFSLGTVDLDLNGHNCNVAAAVAQKRPNFIERLRSRREAATAATKTLPPDPECPAGFLLAGSAKVHDASFNNPNVRLHDINGGAQVRITPTQLLFTALSGYLPGGGEALGELKIDNWLGEVPANTPSTSPTVKAATTTANKTTAVITGKVGNATALVAPPVGTAHAYLTVKVGAIPLRTIMNVTAPKDYGDLGFDTALTGPLKAEWGGPVVNVADSVVVDANFTLAPTGHRLRGAHSDVPIRGQLVGRYIGRNETVAIQKLVFNTLQSTFTANGILGVNLGDPLTALNVDLVVRDFAEYDQLLLTLGLTGNGKKGAAAIPVDLHGSANFHGTARGALARLDVKGHLVGDNLDIRLGDIVNAPPDPAYAPKPAVKNLLTAAATAAAKPAAPPAPIPVTDIHIDNLVADADYTPQGVAVGSSTLTQGTAVIHIAGKFIPKTVMVKHVATYVWGPDTTLDSSIQMANANVTDLLTIAGQKDKIPLTGSVVLDTHLTGTFADLNGAGTINLRNGVAYGEPYEAIDVTASADGQQVEATQVALRLHGMSITGNGGYNLTSRRVHGHIQGNDLRLSRFALIQKQKLNADGVLSLNADADGTLEQPNLKAKVRLANVVATINGQTRPIGEANLDAHSQGSDVFYTLRSTLIGTQVAADGKTNLTGDYQTDAKLTLTNLDIARPIALFAPGKIAATSNISGTATISGPARTPMKLAGKAEFATFEVASQGITLKAAEPLMVGLRNGLAQLDQVHITGTDTDLHASGTAQVFGAIDPKTKLPSTGAGKLDVKANGTISVALAHTFDPDIISSGKVLLAVAATGVIANPSLTGKIDFQNVNVAVEGIPNGVSALNGTLVFNEDRLNVQSLVATTGGGQLKIGGFLTYRNGIYADLTASGDNVRVRYNGLSSTANASLRLQGDPTSSRLSGSVLLTRFGVGADVDFAAFAAAGAVQAPPDPSSAANKIQLDVHFTSSPQLDFQNSYAKLAGTVDLTIRGTVEEPTVLGRIQITDGSATFASTKYQLQRGDIYFTNPVRIDPVIDLDATARVESYDVTVGLHGTSTNLKPTYRSEPPLSEADIFALLALGRTQEESQIYTEQQVQSGTDPTANALLSGALNATVSNRVSKLFGAASVKIDPSYVGTLGSTSARITVQQKVSRQLTLTYATNVNSQAQQLIQVQYDLTPTQSIVAARDETGVFSVVYKIRRAYH